MDDDLLPLHSQSPARTPIRPWLGRGQPVGAYMMTHFLSTPRAFENFFTSCNRVTKSTTNESALLFNSSPHLVFL